MGKGGGAPQAPDPQKTAQAQTASNVETAIAQSQLNNVNQITPYGSLIYTRTDPSYTPHNGGGTPTANSVGGPMNGGSGVPIMAKGGGTFAPSTAQAANIPQWTATQTLSPEQQQIFNQSQGAQLNLATVANQQSGRLGDLLSKPMDAYQNAPAAANAGDIRSPQYTQFSGGPQYNQTGGERRNIQYSLGGNDFSSDRQRVEDALFSRLDSRLDRDRETLDRQLINRGISPGSSAYSRAINDFDQSKAESRTSAILGAGQEQNRLQQLAMNAGNFANSAQQQNYNQSMQNAGFENLAKQQQFDNQTNSTMRNNALQDSRFATDAAKFGYQNTSRDRAINEALAQRQAPLNELIALSSGTQIQQPNFMNTPQTGIAGTDIAGITQNAYSNQMNAYNQQQQQNNSLMGGLFGLGANAMMAFSDRRLKENIKKVGKANNGLNLYLYNYKGNRTPQIGVMAQEVEKKNPNAVHTHESGYKMVDYAEAV